MPAAYVDRMHRLVAAAVVVLAASPAAADGVYFTEALGGTDVDNELAASMSEAIRFRIAGGVRRGNIAVEASFGAHFDVDGSVGPVTAGDARSDYQVADALTTFGVDVKYLQPLDRHVELYLRGSASYAMLDGDAHGYAGRGLGVGAGAQVKGRVRALGFLFWPLFFANVGPKITAAAYVDAGYDFYRLHPGGDRGARPAIDAELHTVTVGFAIGSDF